MPRLRRPLPTAATIALLLLGSLGAAAAWVLVAMALDRQSSWMALVAAADAALILRMARMRPGAWRALAGVAATLLAIAAANWGIVAAWLGRYMGMMPWESMVKLGDEFGWLLVLLSNSPADLAWMGLALVVAALASR